MIRPLSMTSFGRGEYTHNGRTWIAEIKSVNHRYLDVKIKLPTKYIPLEERIRQQTAANFSRGHINVFLSVVDNEGASTRFLPNLDLARAYYQCLTSIQNDLDLQDPPDLALLATFRDIITPQEIEEDLDVIWPDINLALQAAFDACLKMRENEGQTLKKDLLHRLALFQETVADIQSKVPALLAARETALKERLDKLLKQVDVDPSRLAQEVAIMADKTDVTEEIVRLQSHMQQFEQFLDLDEPVGRRLDFLSQEFLREINTLASKINDAPTMHQTVELKNELEKMREQVQNLE